MKSPETGSLGGGWGPELDSAVGQRFGLRIRGLPRVGGLGMVQSWCRVCLGLVSGWFRVG